jgi:ribosome-associated protein
MDDLVIGRLVISGEDLEERFETSGGPGGQHANRSRTTVTLRFRVAESSLPEDTRAKLVARLGEVVEVQAGESRSQHRNRQMARDRLAERITRALREPRTRRATGRTRASRERRLAAKQARSETKRRRRRPQPDD